MFESQQHPFWLACIMQGSFQQLQKILICVTVQQGGASIPQARFKRAKDSAIPVSTVSVPLFLKTLGSWDS